MKNEPHATQTAQSFQSTKEIDASAKSRMEKVLSDLQHEMAGVRTGRASVSLLDNVKADYYGTPTPLNQLATLHHIAEDHRVAMRNVRRDANEHVKKLLKDKAISEDEDRRAHEEIQKLTDGSIQKLDQAAKAKEKEILELK